MTSSVLAVAFATTAALAAAQVPAMPTAPALATTTGQAEVRAEPDEVTFSIEINTQGPDLAAAKAANAKLTAAATAYLRERGVAARDIQTRYLNVRVEYRDYRDRNDPRYVADQAIGVRLRDVAQFETVNQGLLELGVTGLSGPTFDSSQRDSLEAEARRAAVLDAKTQAEALAGALGQEIGSAYRIDDARSGGPDMRMREMAVSARSSDAAAGDGIATGELVIEQAVTVSFYLRD